MGIITEVANVFGIRQTPWVIRVYLVLLLVCVGLIVFASNGLPRPFDASDPMVKLFDFAMDSFKIVLGAVIGSLSMAASAKWSTPGNRSDDLQREGAGDPPGA